MSRGALISQFLALYPDLRSRLRGRLRSQDLADEALNETWLRLNQGAEPNAVRDARAYLSRMAMNIAIDHRRAGARLAAAADIDAVLGAVPDAAPDPERTLAGRQQIEHLQQAIARLTPRRRQVLAAVRLEGRSCQEVAQAMGLSKRTVEMELKRALDHCAEHLAALEKNKCGDASSGSSYGRKGG